MANTLTKVGRYQIVSELGRGSMGVVYQGFDPVIGRTIAIKTMLTEGLSPAEFQEFKGRFQREAQAAGVLAHPNIVTVYDFGEDTGVLYLAMEFLQGSSLQHIIDEQNVLPIETIVPMYEQVCGALDHAHVHKIVHRDIKPANIMILSSGMAKVTDFGIAKMMSMGMTQAGQILGTPNYMSPEQVKGRSVDGRSDIFSLGVILYELVTGEKPFGGQNITTVIYKIINEEPIPPRELDASIPPGLSYVISKALVKDPEGRYQTCRELADDLKNYKNLDGGASAGSTVVIKVPAFQLTQPPQQSPAGPAAPPQPFSAQQAASAGQMPAERELKRPPSVQVIHPAKPKPSGTSPWVWVLGVVLVAGLVGGGYFLSTHGAGTPSREVPANPSGTTSSNSTTSGPQGTASPPSSTGPTNPAGPAGPTSSGGTTTGTPLASTATPGVGATDHPTTETVTSTTAATPKAPDTGKPAASKVGEIVVTSNVEGASISLDGKSKSGWVTPHTFSNISAGLHVVTVSKDGYHDWEKNVTAEGGSSVKVSARLEEPTGELDLNTNPPGAEVLIDGRSYGSSPIQATLKAGRHTYAINRPGKDPYEGTVDVKVERITTKSVDLSSSGAVTGIVEVLTIPAGATVYADDKRIEGQTPISFRLTTGHHVLKISLPGYPPKRQEVEVTAGGSVPVKVIFSH